jgi:crotonobetainyl-CoA:carnitine CoA-transferase CaiB-like acyl-CoA transferase
MGHPEWGDELLAIRDGATLTKTMLDRIESVSRTLSLDECQRRFREFDVPSAPCFDLEGHLADPQIEHNAVYEVVDAPGLGRVRVPRHPARCDAWGRLASPVPAPLLDEGRADVLGDR